MLCNMTWFDLMKCDIGIYTLAICACCIVVICWATTESTSISIRLNSSKQAQAPELKRCNNEINSIHWKLSSSLLNKREPTWRFRQFHLHKSPSVIVSIEKVLDLSALNYIIRSISLEITKYCHIEKKDQGTCPYKNSQRFGIEFNNHLSRQS